MSKNSADNFEKGVRDLLSDDALWTASSYAKCLGPLDEMIADYVRRDVYRNKQFQPARELDGRERILGILARAHIEPLVSDLFGLGAQQCESQIEEVFFYGLVIAAWGLGAGVWYGANHPVDLSLGHGAQAEFNRYEITCQAQIGTYKLDFKIKHVDTEYDSMKRLEREIAIECDGHDFHERTKEQARHDKRRDRELMSAGLPVVRFTGSEIWADPVGKAKWALIHLRHQLWREHRLHEFRERGEGYFQEFVATKHHESHGGLIHDTGMTPAEWAAKLGFSLPGNAESGG